MIEKTMNSKTNSTIILAQALLWAWIVVMPGAISLFTGDNPQDALKILITTLKHAAPLLIIYILNFNLLIPKLLFNGKASKYFIINVLLILIPEVIMYYIKLYNNQIPVDVETKIYVGLVVYIFINILCIASATGIRYIMRWNDLQIKIKEEELKSAEAEVNWLKYQLNPHFLFNTLNNISSLTQFDPDKAQASIAQLSDLLRYAIYDSNQPMVPLKGEIDFMDNYIDLMRLRCNDLTKIEKHFDQPEKDAKIAPLLFISLIENAFKHGINSRKESFVKIVLSLQGKEIVFTCENSYFHNGKGDKIGSGIGLENLKRRLELLYHGFYEYYQEVKEETYLVKVTIKFRQ